MKNKKKELLNGLRDGIPIGLGYLAVSFSLGIVAKGAGITAMEGFWASFFTAASAGEYAVFLLIGAGASYIEVALMTLVANARYLLMSCSMSQKFDQNEKIINRICIGAYITDELFGINIARKGKIEPAYSYGAILTAIPLWALGTALGVIAGNKLPPAIVSALGVALYGMFVAIIIPPAIKNKVISVLVLISFALSYAFSRIEWFSFVSDGTKIIILTVLISAAGAFFFPVKEDNAMDKEDFDSGNCAYEENHSLE